MTIIPTIIKIIPLTIKTIPAKIPTRLIPRIIALSFVRILPNSIVFPDLSNTFPNILPIKVLAIWSKDTDCPIELIVEPEKIMIINPNAINIPELIKTICPRFSFNHLLLFSKV